MGTIGRKADPPANTRSDDSLNLTLPTPLPAPRRIEHEAADKMASPESRLPSYQWSPRSGLGCSHKTTGGLVPEPTRLAYMVDQFHIGDSSPFQTHPWIAIPTHVAPPPIRFQCDKCGITFSRQYDHNRHYESTHSENPPVHKCERYGKQFSRAYAKKRHKDGGKCLNSIPLGLHKE